MIGWQNAIQISFDNNLKLIYIFVSLRGFNKKEKYIDDHRILYYDEKFIAYSLVRYEKYWMPLLAKVSKYPKGNLKSYSNQNGSVLIKHFLL